MGLDVKDGGWTEKREGQIGGERLPESGSEGGPRVHPGARQPRITPSSG